MTEQQLSHYDAVNGPAENADVWRSEVQNRLERYKRRRGRRIEGAYTMRFPFPADEEVVEAQIAEAEEPAAAEMEIAPDFAVVPELDQESDTAAEFCVAKPAEASHELELPVQPSVAYAPVETASNDFALQPSPAVEEEDVPFVDTVVRPRPKRKVIAFPKHLSVAPVVVHRLADPVTSDAPRILDVPEELEAIPATPFLDGLQLDLPTPAEEAARREHVDLPFQPATTGHRMLAGAVDLGITGVSAAVFGAVAFRLLNHPPISKFLIMGLLAGVVVLWTAYQYMFVVYAGKTIGMMAAHIRLRTFKGNPPNVQKRRRRVLSLYLSSLSLGMGLMWAFVDVDGLCWHDRLSGTYLTDRN